MTQTQEHVGYVIQNGCRFFSGDLDCKGRSLADPTNWTTRHEEATTMRREIASLILSRAPLPYREKLSLKKLTIVMAITLEEAE
jgi:hypothetical protein